MKSAATAAKSKRGTNTIVPVVFCGLFLALHAKAQTLTITEGVQTFESLVNTTVTMTGKSELRVTSATTPISGCQINLNSADAWLLLGNIRPSVVNAAAYLGQIRVSGTAAALNTNCRIVEYGDGTVVIPQGSLFAPLQVFAGKYFSGTSSSLQNFTAYNDAALGGLANAISSFKLKRGYTATFAQNADGSGVSRNYVAQDGDLEISVMPDDLNDSVSFVRVFPWRWVSKKGIAGNITSGLNVRWWYDWNIGQTSSLDCEYVPIRQSRWWPDLAGQNWSSRGASHLLGYNEPDQASQANLAVGDAIGSWPDLLATGLRVGSPAPSDGGLSWLYSFMDQTGAANLRCDFVAVHYYRSYSDPANPDGATTQLYNFLKGVHDRTNRPIWLTEWNNGANWTTDPDPTAAQQQATIAKMIEMLDNTPFVERYSLYNWVEDVRRVKWDDGSLTAAGTTYRDKVSPIGYSQALPAAGGRGIAQFTFDGDTLDSSGYGNGGLAAGRPAYVTGQRDQAINLDGSAGYVQLPDKIANGAAFSFAGWINWDGGANWQRIFDFGADTTHYAFLTPSSGTGKLRFAIRNGGSEQIVETTALATGQWKHVAVTLAGGTVRLYVNGVQAAAGGVSITPAQFGPSSNFLGRSQFPVDPLFNGRFDDVRIADYAFSAAQVAALMTDTPPQFTTSPIAGPAGSNDTVYSGTLAGTATDAGDTITYAKAGGPAWLLVAANGVLSGTPALANVGTNEFIVCATDAAGATAYSILTIPIAAAQVAIVWDGGSGGAGTELSTAANWAGDVVPNGANAEIALFNGTVAGDLSLTYNTTSANLGNANGISISLANGQTGAVTLDGTASSPNLRLGNNAITIAPQAGPLTFGNGSGTFNITLGFGAGTQTFTNNSTHTAAFKSDVVFANGGAAAHTLQFTGSGNWLLNNPLAGGSTFSLAKSGGGALTLTGANSHSGTTTLNAGTLNINSAGALGGGGVFTINGGTINNTSAAAVSITTAKAQTWAGDFHFGGSSDLNLGGGVVTLAGTDDRTLTLAGSNTLTVGRIVSTIGGFALGGDGALAITTAAASSIVGGLDVGVGATLRINTGATAGTTGDFIAASLNGSGTIQNGGGVERWLVITGAGDATFDGLLENGGAGALGLSKTGSGTLTLAATNTYTGPTSILSAVVVRATATNALGTGTINFDNSGGTPGPTSRLELRGGISLGNTTINLNQRNNDTVAIQSLDGDNVLTGSILIVTGGSKVRIQCDAGTLTLAGNISTYTISSRNLYLQGLSNGTVGGAITDNPANTAGRISIIKEGAGKWTLNGNNTYSGTTTVAAGTLLINGTHSGSAVAVANNATLGGNGTISGTVTIQSGGIVSPGDGAGTLTIAGNLTLPAAAKIRMEINKPAATHDTLVIGGALAFGGTLEVVSLGGALVPGDSFTLFQAASISGSFATVTLPALGTGFAWDSSRLAGGILAVVGVPSIYQGWAAGYPLPPGADGPSHDADGDGIANAFEWLFGSNPLASDTVALPQALARTLTTAEYPAATPGKHYLTMTARIRKTFSGVTLVPQANRSINLLDSPASSGFVTSFATSLSADFEQRTWIYTVPLEDSPTGRGFMRLKIISQ